MTGPSQPSNSSHGSAGALIERGFWVWGAVFGFCFLVLTPRGFEWGKDIFSDVEEHNPRPKQLMCVKINSEVNAQ